MPMVVTDPRQLDNPIAFVNHAFPDLTLYEEKDLIGRNCRPLQGPQTSPDTVSDIRHALAERRAVALDILNYKANGPPFWNALYIGPIFDQEGELLYFFCLANGYHQRRASEQSSLQAQEMEAIGQLTAGMVHDFNNLLQVITHFEMALLNGLINARDAMPDSGKSASARRCCPPAAVARRTLARAAGSRSASSTKAEAGA